MPKACTGFCFANTSLSPLSLTSEMSTSTLIRTLSSLRSPEIGGRYESGWSNSLRRTCSAKLSPLPGSPVVALHFDAKQVQEQKQQRLLRRARSDADLVVLGCKAPTPSRALEEEEEEEDERQNLGLTRFDFMPPAPELEVDSSGGGIGKDRMIGGGGNDGWKGGGGGGDQSENRKMGEYYRQLLRSDPCNPLLLRNYGRYLHEVEGDTKGAEECYGRAILTSPEEDGELLSLYGNLLWEMNKKDGERAESYLERAVEASPDDCFVLGSYANFLWDAEEEEEDEEREEQEGKKVVSTRLVKVFS